MTNGLPPLLGLAAFEAAARRGSFVEAARELHLSPSAVSHRVKVLEQHLGRPLFERLARSLRMTDHGRAYLPVVQATLDSLLQGTDGVFGIGRRPADLTVRVPVSYGDRVLAPRLGDVLGQIGICVQVVSSIWGPGGVDLEADLSVELDTEAGEHLGGPVEAVLVFHPDHVWPDGSGWAGPALRKVDVLGFEHLWADPLLTDSPIRVGSVAEARVDTWSAALAVVGASPGWCALVPDILTRHDVALGRLAVGPLRVSMAQRFRIRRRMTGDNPPGLDPFVGWLHTLHGTASDGSD